MHVFSQHDDGEDPLGQDLRRVVEEVPGAEDRGEGLYEARHGVLGVCAQRLGQLQGVGGGDLFCIIN